MATLDFANILAALSGVNKAAAQDDPFSTLADIGSQVGPAILKNSANFSPWETILASLAAGAVGGIGQNLSSAYTDDQEKIANDQVRSILSGGDIYQAPNQSPSVFNSLKTVQAAKDMVDAADLQSIPDKIAISRAGNPQYEPLGGQSGSTEIKATRGPDGGLQISYGTNNGGPDNTLVHSALTKAQLGQDLSPEETSAITSAPRATQQLFLNYQNQSAVSDRAGRVSEKSALDITGPLAIGADITKGLQALDNVYKQDPSLLDKAWNQLPLGSDAYNVFKGLQVDGARAAKVLEGRVNDTTLNLYTNLLTSLSTEPLSAVKDRAAQFVQSLRDDSVAKANMLGSTGRDVTGILKSIDLLVPPTASSGGSGPSVTREQALNILRQRGVIK